MDRGSLRLVNAFIKFINSNDLDIKVIVKMLNPRKIQIRLRPKQDISQIIFPDWIDRDVFEDIRKSKPLILLIQNKRLKKRVLDYMLIYFNCNTHSLRYSFINYMLTDKQMPMATVAKVVGHVNVNQLVTYTQQKNVDAALELDI